MTERPATRRYGSVRLGCAISTLAASVACVSTEAEPSQVRLPCVSSPDTNPGDAIVSVEADLKSGVLRCSGIAIAPSLVLTALGCVVRPAELGDPPLDASSRDGSLHPGGADYDSSCIRTSAWLAREDGSFSGRLGKTVEPSDVIVYREGVDEELSAVSILTSGAVSRCEDGVALLTLGRDLDVPQIALRFDETTKLDEPVILGGHCLTSGTPQRRDVASIVSEVTFELGTPSAPPRALVMPDAASSFDLGGGVLSSETGALIAVIASGRNPSCAAANPDGSLAIRIAPFRRMLLDAAVSRGVTLRAEPTDQTSAALMPCADD